METVKDVLNLFNTAIFYNYENLGNFEDLNQARECIINNFQEAIPISRILITLFNTDVVILKINDNDIENIIENFLELIANILCTIGFEKVVKDDVDRVMNQEDNLLINLVIRYLCI